MTTPANALPPRLRCETDDEYLARLKSLGIDREKWLDDRMAQLYPPLLDTPVRAAFRLDLFEEYL